MYGLCNHGAALLLALPESLPFEYWRAPLRGRNINQSSPKQMTAVGVQLSPDKPPISSSAPSLPSDSPDPFWSKPVIGNIPSLFRRPIARPTIAFAVVVSVHHNAEAEIVFQSKLSSIYISDRRGFKNE
jgi:hypothetical protein